MILPCDIFCSVIDNYGDIGVCWRLARQLHTEHQLTVTLWVDDLAAFARLAPMLDISLPTQKLDGLTVRHWTGDIANPVPGAIVIEGFGCKLPTDFLAAMGARPRAPLWINMEYLSAEAWVEDCHALPSIHPATGLTQYFWFPGLTEKTGGLLREAGLLERRQQFQADKSAQATFWNTLGLPEAVGIPLRISLFAYENLAVGGLLDTLAHSATPALIVVPEGRVLADVARWATLSSLKAGDRLSRGSLQLAVLPFLSPDIYDRLLWGCEINAIRGEDSFVRAQWAGRPLLWHIYPQEEGAHWAKLEAFIRAADMPPPWEAAMHAWNGGEVTTHTWAALLAALPALTPAFAAWSGHLAAQQDLASGLMHFYASQVE